jgi:hypothetical protein
VLNLYIPQCNSRCIRDGDPSTGRIGRNGNQESSYKGPREEGRKKGSQEKVAGLSNQKATGEGERDLRFPFPVSGRFSRCLAMLFSLQSIEKELDLQRSK